MKTWEIKIKLSVADSWIADGFDASERLEDIQDDIKRALPYAHDWEVKVKATITKAPAKKVIEQLQNGELPIKD